MSTNHPAGTVSDKDLADLFERRAPEPIAFRAQVEERIAERRRAAEAQEGEQKARPQGRTFMRRAAAVLPIDPIGGGQAGSALLKWMYSALALPALVLGSSIGSFLVSVRAVKHEMNSAKPTVPGPLAWSAFSSLRSGRHFPKPLNGDLQLGGWLLMVVNLGMLLTLLISFLTGGRTAMDVLSVVLLIAMGSVVLTIRGLGQAGLLSRRETARFTVGLLITVFTGCFLWFSTVLSTPDGHAELGVGGSSAAVLIGIVVCTAFGWGLLRGLLAASVVGLLVLTYNPLAFTESTPSALRTQLAQLELEPESLRGWKDAAAVFTALESVGETTPDLTSTSKSLALALEEGVAVHPVVWTAAARMGLIDNAQWVQILDHAGESTALDSLVLPGRKLNSTTYYEYRVPMLLATRDPSAEEREHLAGNLAAAWPEGESHSPLATAAMLVHCFELLGRDDLVRSHEASIRGLLRSHWIAPGSAAIFGDPGGFSPDPKEFERSFVSDTWAAIELMGRAGVPEGIEPRWIRGYLQNEARAGPWFLKSGPTSDAMSRAALLRLERELGLPDRGWLESLLAERLLIATLLLVALCVMAIRLAPPGPEEMGTGAQP